MNIRISLLTNGPSDVTTSTYPSTVYLTIQIVLPFALAGRQP